MTNNIIDRLNYASQFELTEEAEGYLFNDAADTIKDLLAALESMFDKYGSKNSAMDDEVTAQARAVIARVKGQS